MTAIREARHVKGDRTWWRYIRTAKSPELPVVLLEDIGAEAGLVVALLGLIMADVTGDARWDAVGSISIGVLLVVIAVVLAIEMKGLLLGESASDEQQSAIEAAISGSPSVRGIIHVRTMHLGPDQILVAAKVEYDPDLEVSELAVAINATEAALRSAVPLELTIYIEPDIRRTLTP